MERVRCQNSPVPRESTCLADSASSGTVHTQMRPGVVLHPSLLWTTRAADKSAEQLSVMAHTRSAVGLDVSGGLEERRTDGHRSGVNIPRCSSAPGNGWAPLQQTAPAFCAESHQLSRQAIGTGAQKERCESHISRWDAGRFS
eukprot:3351328-Rhodomonas_salina.2